MTSGGGVITDQELAHQYVSTRDTRHSDGAEVRQGDRIRMHYQIALSESDAAAGRWVEDSWPSDEPVEFTVGRGEVLAGIDHAAVGMRLASYRIATISPPAGLGSRGSTNRVPPDATLWCTLYIADILAE